MAISGSGTAVDPSGPSWKTRPRSLQRKHSQHSYMLMKEKLLNLVRPIPDTALQVERLESFREHLYTTVPTEPEPLPLKDNTDSIPSNIPSNICCNWCGTWMPIPRQTYSAINLKHSDIEATEATAAENLEVIVDADAAVPAEITTGKDEYSDDLGAGILHIETNTPELSNPDLSEYLTGTGVRLCCVKLCVLCRR